MYTLRAHTTLKLALASLLITPIDGMQQSAHRTPETNLQSLNSQLHAAAQEGLADLVSTLLVQGADKDSADISPTIGATPLYRAACRGHAPVIRLLLEVNADFTKECHNRTPLEAAFDLGHSRVVDLLLPKTSLNLAAGTGKTRIVELLLANNADVNERGIDSGTPLMRAAYFGHAHIVELLVAAGAHTDIHVNGWTALDLAISNNYTQIIDLLIPKANIHWAASALNRVKIVELLLERGANIDGLDEDGSTPLFRAAFFGRTPVVELLLQRGADKEIRCIAGATPLFAAAHQGHADIIKLLLDAGAKKDERRSIDGITPLCVAAHNGCVEVVELLLGRGANQELEADGGQTPLFAAIHSAVCSRAKYPRAIQAAKLLLQNDAHTRTSWKGCLPLGLAVQTGNIEILQLLLTMPAGALTTKGVKTGSLSYLNGYATDSFTQSQKMAINRLLKFFLSANNEDGIRQIFFSPTDLFLRDILIWLIRCEQQRIRIATFLIPDKLIVKALKEAHQNGVRVELVIDGEQYNDDQNCKNTVNSLIKNQVPIFLCSMPHGSIHSKVVLFERNIEDLAIIWNGSLNVVHGGCHKNGEDLKLSGLKAG